jgi:hypothetical protein
MTEQETRDLHKLFERIKDMSWKTAPSSHMKALLELTTLWGGLIDLAPSGLLAPTDVTRGVDAANMEAKCNYTKKTSTIFADYISMKIRQGLSKIRLCKKDDQAKAKASRNLSLQETGALDQLLLKITEDAEEDQLPHVPISAACTSPPAKTRLAIDADGFPIFPGTDQSEDTAVRSRPVSNGAGDFSLSKMQLFSEEDDFFAKVLGADPVTPKEKRDTKKNLRKRPASKQPKDQPTTKEKKPASTAGPRAAEHPKNDKKNIHSRAYHAELSKCKAESQSCFIRWLKNK